MESTSKSSTLSRLDRVFTLLENGSSPITRKAAAKQLGDVQKKYPHELNHLLAKLLVYIKHTEWSTRIAAAGAIESVISHVVKWNPEPENRQDGENFSCDAHRLKLSQFDVERVLKGSALLLGSSGEEYKTEDGGGQLQDKIKRQRLLLEKRLGLTLGGSASFGVSSDDLFNDDDLIENNASVDKGSLDSIRMEPCSSVLSQITEGMSSREKNKAKRKARMLIKQQNRNQRHKQDAETKESQPLKKRKLGKGGAASVDITTVSLDNVPEHPPDPKDWKEWPFEWICEELANMLFSTAWETRHGACTALRDILKKHGSGCGKVKGMTSAQLNTSHQMWLCDAAVRLLCVIALDRFADYVSDQVTAPVRESCAQTLSMVARYMAEDHVFDTITILMHLFAQKEWEVRQSALLSLQYIVAVRQDLQPKLLSVCFATLSKGLQDSDGDVRSVSAKAFLPMAHLLLESDHSQNLQLLLKILWDSLSSYDELTASTQSILLLLSNLLKSLPASLVCSNEEPATLARRLLPFFHHVSADVRCASYSTLNTMILSDTSESIISWLEAICVDSLWNLFQSCLLEPKTDVRKTSIELFQTFVRRSSQKSLLASIRHLPQWLTLSCQPDLVPIDNSLLIQSKSSGVESDIASDSQKLIGGPRSSFVPSSGGLSYLEHVSETRLEIARMLGVLCCHSLKDSIPESHTCAHHIGEHLTCCLTSQSALQRMVAAMVIDGWWKESLAFSLLFPEQLSPALHSAMTSAHTENLYYSEITLNFIQIQTDIKNLLAAVSQRGISLQGFTPKTSYSFEEVQAFCTDHFPSLLPRAEPEVANQNNLLLKLVEEAIRVQTNLDCRVKSFISSALVSAASAKQEDRLWKLPQKLNPVIRPLMESIKTEENRTIRRSVANSIADLLGLCTSRQPCPNPKLMRNLFTSLTASTDRCPTVTSVRREFSDELLSTCGVTREKSDRDVIITLLRQQAAIASDINSKKRKRQADDDHCLEDTNQARDKVCSAGAECCLKTICVVYGSSLFQVVPTLWAKISSFKDLVIAEQPGSEQVCTDALIEAAQSLSTLEVVVPVLVEDSLKEQALAMLHDVINFLWSDWSILRYLATRCLAVFAHHMAAKVMPEFVEQVTESLNDQDNPVKRRGAVEAVAALIEEMGVGVVPYAVLLVVSLLGRMSDHEQQIRMLATHCFAQLIQYMPVESSIPDPPNMPDALMKRKAEERRFLEQLFDGRSLDSYHVPVVIKATLRSYQEDGVKWLAFLNRFKLHGILCDDMGLGKTLQTICIIASDHYYKTEKLKEREKRAQLRSLVVCPPTLTGHWVEEVNKFSDDLNPLHYAGNPQERLRLQSAIGSHNLVVASYEVVRNDISFFSRFKWNYCVLDEGHAIRNGKSKITQCVKSLISHHRLILTGTPIQNSVLELWSLFDFLIPGFLGSEPEFNARFTKPILASRDAKNSSKEQEEGIVALEALHRQVLPFMLRRMKEDVLKDLPPKIIQDYYCDLSPLQLQLYEDFARSRAKKDAESTITKINAELDQKTISKDASHVFQALQYLQKVCNHPMFVLSPSHPHYQRFMTQLKSGGSSLHDIKHAAKLPSLRQLLLDCGIGVPPDSGAEFSVVGQHRALIFCQHRNMLDVIQNDLFAALMPGVTYLRLDGAVPANQRFSIVSRFNNDPSIDVLLLTTKVGGLGLNLTGADTVVFVEHDWNPMVDLQAMDRAHRIGQKKVVNVYRLITRGTLEEKILGLQKFKLNVANTIVSDDNKGLQSMGTGQVLELFDVDKGHAKKAGSIEPKASSKGLRAMIDSLGELWGQNQYDEEYDIDHFIQSLS